MAAARRTHFDRHDAAHSGVEVLGSLVGSPRGVAARAALVGRMAAELTTVADDEVVFHDGDTAHRFDGLEPDTDYTFLDTSVRTLPRPGGALLCRFATVNDVHFGETECGVLEELESGPVFHVEPGEPPYPEMMNSGAIAEITAIDPAAVIVKGDLTADGRDEEYAAFLRFYGGAFGDRLHTVRGNHDGYRGQTYEVGDREVVLPGVRVLVLDTVIPFETTGRITKDQLAWVDTLSEESDRAVMVMGHHHPWSPDSREAQPHLLRSQPRRLGGPGRCHRAATLDPRVLRRAHPSQPRAPLRARRARSLTSKSRASRTSRARGPSTACSRAV